MTQILTCNQSTRRSVAAAIVCALLASILPGCSLGVMAGKMFFGDPKVKSHFRAATGVDLTKGEKSLLIVCQAPHGILNKYPSMQLDVVDRMTRHLETRHVNVVPSDDVANWVDDHGDWGDFSELADEFNADYVMLIEIESFICSVPDSPNLLQGKTSGKVTVLESDQDKSQDLIQAFERTFSIEFPGYPVPRESKSESLFTEGFLDEVAIHLCHYLYDHRVSETVH